MGVCSGCVCVYVYINMCVGYSGGAHMWCGHACIGYSVYSVGVHE